MLYLMGYIISGRTVKHKFFFCEFFYFYLFFKRVDGRFYDALACNPDLIRTSDKQPYFLFPAFFKPIIFLKFLISIISLFVFIT